MTWDKLSDIDMATDYSDRGLELDTAGHTELLARRQEEFWITNFVTRLRVNKFQTLKQELPTWQLNWKPFEFGRSGIISDNQFIASYLDFIYSPDQLKLHAHDYHSGRLQLNNRLYRPINYNIFTLTPEIGSTLIYYNYSPHERERLLAVGVLGCDLRTSFYRFYGNCKHVIQPFTTYTYYTAPTSPPHEHFIFDIEDGWHRLDMLTFGIHNSFYTKRSGGCISRNFLFDLWTNAFFDTPTLKQSIPRLYSKLSCNSFAYLRHTVGLGWDFERNEILYFNVRNGWTVNENLAIALEYRHRSSYDWRKADKTNFVLDATRTEEELRHSQLSDRRDTLLIHLFCRLNPNWACEFEARHGWNRLHEPSYTEYEFDILARVWSAWNIKLSYQHKEYDRGHDRIAIYFTLGLKPPDKQECESFVPCLEF